MCIGYLELNQLKVSLSVYELPFLLFNIFTTFVPLICFCKSFEKILSKSFANSQRDRNKIARSILRFEIPPPVSNAFPLTK
jgi:hypothetical protein